MYVAAVDSEGNAASLINSLYGVFGSGIVAGNTGVARAIQKLLPNTPVVLNGGGLPVEAGIVDSLARPGRNVTGVTAYADNAVFGKYLQLLREAKPPLRCHLLTNSQPMTST